MQHLVGAELDAFLDSDEYWHSRKRRQIGLPLKLPERQLGDPHSTWFWFAHYKPVEGFYMYRQFLYEESLVVPMRLRHAGISCLQDLVASYPMDDEVVQEYKELHSAMASPDYINELRKILDKGADYVLTAYEASISRIKGAEEFYFSRAPEEKSLVFIDIAMLAYLTLEASYSIVRKHTVTTETPEHYGAFRMIYDIYSRASDFIIAFSHMVLDINPESFRIRLQRGM
ncbi:hypothetical protein BJ508DRAFT_364857, partial [Ascobolus immersus RN42]